MKQIRSYAESLNGPRAASVCYHPLCYNVLVYEPAMDKLQINICSVP